MLIAKILNSSATVNQFKYLDTVQFIGGSNFRFAFRLFDPQLKERYIPGSAAIVKLTFNKCDGTELEKTSTVLDSGDRSMRYIDFSQAETEELLGGNAKLLADLLGDATQIEEGVIESALSRVTTD